MSDRGELLNIGPFVLDRSAMALLREGKAVAIGQRALALLFALVDADGPVTKQALMEAGWPGTAVEEGNLTVQIAALRKALGERDDGGEWIVTVPRVGYRLLRTAETAVRPEAGPALPTIAVLPFQNMSADPEQDYFADGIVEDITTALSRFRNLAVISRNSAFAFKGRAVDVRETARELGARYVLEGSVRRAGLRLRITAQLVDGASGAHMWANNFDGTLDDVFDFQDRITQSVVSLVEPTIKRAEIERVRQKPPASLDAYDLYLQALALVLTTEPGANGRAIDLIERSLAVDPDFVPAIAVAANAYWARIDQQLPDDFEESRRRGLDYAHLALARAGADANVRAIAGAGVIVLGNEYEAGTAAIRQAVTELPYSVNVLGFAAVGELRGGSLELAEAHFTRAMQLNTNDLSSHWMLSGMAHIRIAQGRYEEALEWAAKGYSATPNNVITHWFVIAANAQLGRMDEARKWWDRLRAFAPATNLAGIARGQQSLDASRVDPILEGLRLVGVPELAPADGAR